MGQRIITRFWSGLGALLLLTLTTVQVFLPGTVFAAGTQITSRSLTLEDNGTTGGSLAGGNVKHLFNFTVDSGAVSDTIGSISFQYCTTADAVTSGVNCDRPAGLDVSAATLSQDTGGITGFTTTTASSVDDQADGVDNVLTIKLASASTVSAATSLTKEFTGIINPTTANQTFYVRIFTYTATTGGTLAPASSNDYGVVAASTANAIQLTGQMPESLVFCTGHTIDINASHVPDCTTATSGSISFNQLFSPSSTTWAYSQMAASTNATNGYAITVNGPTLTSGSNTVTAIGSTAAISQPDTRQFGLNLIDDANPTSPIVTDPTIGTGSADPITYYNGDGAGTGGALNPASDGVNFFGVAATGFNGAGGAGNVPTYSFAAGTNNTVATSNYSGTGSGPTNTQRYTVTYIVNVSGNLPAGSYTSTLTYICTASY